MRVDARSVDVVDALVDAELDAAEAGLEPAVGRAGIVAAAGRGGFGRDLRSAAARPHAAVKHVRRRIRRRPEERRGVLEERRVEPGDERRDLVGRRGDHAELDLLCDPVGAGSRNIVVEPIPTRAGQQLIRGRGERDRRVRIDQRPVGSFRPQEVVRICQRAGKGNRRAAGRTVDLDIVRIAGREVDGHRDRARNGAVHGQRLRRRADGIQHARAVADTKDALVEAIRVRHHVDIAGDDAERVHDRRAPGQRHIADDRARRREAVHGPAARDDIAGDLPLLVSVPAMLVSEPVHNPSFSIVPPVLTAFPFQAPDAKLVIAPVFEATLAL